MSEFANPNRESAGRLQNAGLPADKNIVLIGFMGSGKTTVGKRLAAKIKFSFQDTDDAVEYMAGEKISLLFEKKGEAHFRNLERTAIEAVSKEKKTVIATGGGVIKQEINIENLKRNGTIIYLKADPAHILRNLEKSPIVRPLLVIGDKMERITFLLDERKHLYEKYKDRTVDVSFKSIETICNEIISMGNFT